MAQLKTTTVNGTLTATNITVTDIALTGAITNANGVKIGSGSSYIKIAPLNDYSDDKLTTVETWTFTTSDGGTLKRQLLVGTNQ